jgi:tetratricopeptide (TPR) repeat protein
MDRNKALSTAERMFQQGLFLEPESPRFLLSLTSCFIRLGEKDATNEVLNKMKERCSGDIEGMKEVIGTLLSEKAYDYAHAWIKEAIKQFPEEAVFYMLFARYHREQNRPYDAVACLKRCLSINSSHIESIVALAELYSDIKEYSDSILYYEKAIKILPDDRQLQEKLKQVLKLKYGK